MDQVTLHPNLRSKALHASGGFFRENGRAWLLAAFFKSVYIASTRIPGLRPGRLPGIACVSHASGYLLLLAIYIEGFHLLPVRVHLCIFVLSVCVTVTAFSGLDFYL